MTRSLRPSGRDGGFTLIETVVAVVLMGIVPHGVAGLLIRSTSSAAQIARTNVAAQLADQQMELVRSIKASEATPFASKLLAGRTEAAVQAQWASAPAALAQTTPGLGHRRHRRRRGPLRGAQTVDSQPYRIRTFIGTCRQAQSPTTARSSAPAPTRSPPA
jgi:prepilin-type N-terminal cleavage/methylation domain-containing protein